MDFGGSFELAGRRVSHYKLEEPLGAGGMGAVYRARDLALRRPVAVKVLPPGFTPRLRARLLREADASSKLQHPAIATFYEAGEVDGVAFVAMEYVAGRTLREALRGEGPLPCERALAVAAAVLEALVHAHTAGIIHRDIKPENVMIAEDGRVKVLDLGLAKHLIVTGDPDGASIAPDQPTRTAETVPTQLTGTHAVLGTPGYMAPEQLRGEEVDERADVFAVGVLLHELLTGRQAFPGDTPTERMANVLSRDPEPLNDEGLPPGLAAVVARAMARDPVERYRTASEFLADLRRVVAGDAVTLLPQSLAVLAFDNISKDPESDWIGTGIAESLSVDLGRVNGLSLVSPASLQRGLSDIGAGPAAPVDPVELGRRCGCRWVLSGGYQRSGPRLRLTFRLTEVATGDPALAEKIDGDVDEIFDIQDRVAAAIGKHLDLVLEGKTADKPKIDAYEAYSTGRRHFIGLAKGGFQQAAELYSKAIEADENFAPAYEGLAGLHAMRFTFTTDDAELERAIFNARKAIDLDPQLAAPHAWLGYALFRRRLHDEALRALERAVGLDPESVYGHYFRAAVFASQERYDESLEHLQEALRADADHGFAWSLLGSVHLSCGRDEEARWSFEQALARETKEHGTAGVAYMIGEVLRRRGELEAARERCMAALDSIERSDHMYRDSFLAQALLILGRVLLDMGDREAAGTAFGRAEVLLRGRPRTLAGGFLLVQALAWRSRCENDAALLAAARELHEQRVGFDFSWTPHLGTERSTREALETT